LKMRGTRETEPFNEQNPDGVLLDCPLFGC
jgi:hypothetical protein